MFHYHDRRAHEQRLQTASCCIYFRSRCVDELIIKSVSSIWYLKRKLLKTSMWFHSIAENSQNTQLSYSYSQKHKQRLQLWILPRICMKTKRSSRNSFRCGSLSSSYSCKQQQKTHEERANPFTRREFQSFSHLHASSKPPYLGKVPGWFSSYFSAFIFLSPHAIPSLKTYAS